MCRGRLLAILLLAQCAHAVTLDVARLPGPVFADGEVSAGAALPEGQLPNALEYTAGELRLRGITLTDEEHTAMVTRLQTAGYGARMDDGSLSLRAETTP